MVGSNKVGLLIGTGMMLFSGIILYGVYLTYKQLNDKNKGGWFLWSLFFEMVLDALFSFSVGILGLIGVFLLGFLIVVSITLEFFRVIPFR
ncbi:hypothetical protein [Paenibacillus sp. GP183]|uniref:hypothetical protein n=1 Tax=Paenibacillus sp. GP183 TaxID=1882751 RepID=UPI00089AC8E8|nr:hypothetical protein [Paenibacillus sp. GP183]SEB45514.1 hypothetical protein SAMN05443246_0441 [Paenibacillus sp. GP183]